MVTRLGVVAVSDVLACGGRTCPKDPHEAVPSGECVRRDGTQEPAALAAAMRQETGSEVDHKTFPADLVSVPVSGSQPLNRKTPANAESRDRLLEPNHEVYAPKSPF